MNDLMKLVRTYRLTRGVAERLGLMERILPFVERDLRFFVFGAVQPPAAEDIFQEVLKAFATSLGNFKGETNKEFWKWSYGIARNKIGTYFEKEKISRLQPMPEEELWHLIEDSFRPGTLSAGDRHDLEHILKRLTRSKPECHEYLWNHFVFGLDYAEIAEQQQASYDSVRMKIGRCLSEAQALAE